MDEEEVRTYISLFVFVSTFFYFWRSSLVSRLEDVDNAFKPITEIPMPFGNQPEENDENDLLSLQDEEIDLAKPKLPVKTSVYNLSSLKWLTFGLLFKTMILSLLIFCFMYVMQSKVLSSLYISKEYIEFEAPKAKERPKTVGETLKGQVKEFMPSQIGKQLKRSVEFLKGPKQLDIDAYEREVRYGKNYIDQGKYQGLSYGFLIYVFREVSFVLIAAVICTVITSFYLKYGVSNIFVDRKSYIKSQVRVIYTINIIMFYVVFFGLTMI